MPIQKIIILIMVTLIYILFSPKIYAFQAQEIFTDLTGPYLGQEPPDNIPVIFAPDIVSTQDTTELNSVFTSDGKEFYFTRRNNDGQYVIRVMKRINNVWIIPVVASFSGAYPDVDMAITYDGSKMFFSSMRPKPGTNKPTEQMYIWYMNREKNGWREPVYLDTQVNESSRSLYPSFTNSGTMYFQSNRKTNIGGSDIYRSKKVNRTYLEAENIGTPVNSEFNEYDIVIAPDESYLIVSSTGRSDNAGHGGDLYISFRKIGHSWSTMISMGEGFSSSVSEGCPMLSPDGKFFFTRYEPRGKIYWVDAKVIERYKKDRQN